MFDQLMSLPLFQGVSRERMENTVGSIKFHFLKFPEGETVIRAGEPCTKLSFVLNGSVRSTVVNNTGRFAVAQTLDAPAILAPDFLFGRTTFHPATVVALESSSIVQIDKQDYVRILNSDSVYLLNYLNILSMNSQKGKLDILSLTTGDVDERIAFWISILTQATARDIVLSCRSRDLCSLFNTPRSLFMASLEKMKDAGLLDYTNTELFIKSRSALQSLLHHDAERGEDTTL